MNQRSDPHRSVPGIAGRRVPSGAAGRDISPDLLIPPTALQIGPDPLPGALGELRELPSARVNNGLYLLLRLFRNRNYPV